MSKERLSRLQRNVLQIISDKEDGYGVLRSVILARLSHCYARPNYDYANRRVFLENNDSKMDASLSRCLRTMKKKGLVTFEYYHYWSGRIDSVSLTEKGVLTLSYNT